MAVDYAKIARLQAYSLTHKPDVCEVLAVYWTDAITKYYAISAYDTIIPFVGIPIGPIEARLRGKVFQTFELCSDLSTESISLTFADSDKVVENLFRDNGEGVKCELFYYYPKVDNTNGDDLLYSAWWGHFMLPDFVGKGVLQVSAENGFKSRELLMGHRIRPNLCPSVYGGLFTDINEYRGNGCVYNRQLVGGTLGNLDVGDVPFPSCDKSEGACVVRLGAHANGKPKYWMGFDTEVQSVLSDANSGYLAVSKGNASKLTKPIVIVAGNKYVSDLPNLFYRKELNASNPERGFVRGVWEVDEGPNESISEIVINDKIIETEHIVYRTGELGQGPCAYTPGISGFSGTAHVSAAYGWTNAATTELSSLKTRIKVKGYNKVRVYTDETTYTSIWTQKRAWWLMELYTNMRFGRGYRHNKFHIQDFIDTQTWLSTNIIHTDPNGTTRQTIRDQFDCIIDGRPVQETIIDICRSGRISVPFQWDGSYSITPLSRCADLGAVRVFSDRGNSKNIIVKDGIQAIKKSIIPDSILPNKIVVTYEDSTKFDRARPLVFIDEPQQMRASKSQGLSSFNSIEKRYRSVGHRHNNLAYKLGWSFLELGEFDNGGTKNNLKLEYYVHMEQALGLKKFEVIQVDSDALEDEDFTYFRVMKLKKMPNHEVLVTVQAYPEDHYDAFETNDPSPPSGPVDFPPWFPPVCFPTIGAVSYVDGVFAIPIEPC